MVSFIFFSPPFLTAFLFLILAELTFSETRRRSQAVRLSSEPRALCVRVGVHIPTCITFTVTYAEQDLLFYCSVL